MEEQQRLPEPVRFTSYMTKREIICVLIWLPIHLFVLPLVAEILMQNEIINEAQANLLIYSVSSGYILLAEFTFLRREFDPFCDRKLYCIMQILSNYLIMMAMNLFASSIISGLETLFDNGKTFDNLNNDAIIDLAGKNMNIISAMTIFLAPLVEEIIFRGGIFCSIRKNSRTAAYVISTLLFSAYHIWSYAINEPLYWIYIIQYLPAGFLLCRCYERTNSIWCSIFFHMLTNDIALNALTTLG